MECVLEEGEKSEWDLEPFSEVNGDFFKTK